MNRHKAPAQVTAKQYMRIVRSLNRIARRVSSKLSRSDARRILRNVDRKITDVKKRATRRAARHYNQKIYRLKSKLNSLRRRLYQTNKILRDKERRLHFQSRNAEKAIKNYANTKKALISLRHNAALKCKKQIGQIKKRLVAQRKAKKLQKKLIKKLAGNKIQKKSMKKLLKVVRLGNKGKAAKKVVKVVNRIVSKCNTQIKRTKTTAAKRIVRCNNKNSKVVDQIVTRVMKQLFKAY